MSNKIITRFPPSPTGYLHVGSLRTALYNYLFAKKNKGKFYLRIEDTDQERRVEGAEENLKKILKEFDIDWNNKEVMIQSKRLDIYNKFAEQLVAEKKAYYCFCSKDRLEDLRKINQQTNLPQIYDRHCLNLTENEIKKNKENGKYVIRFKVSNTGITELNDLIRGKVSFDNKTLDDPIIIKSDGYPTYHLASIVDDHEMGITHVIRGEEWLPSAPKHKMLYDAFGWEIPKFAHLPLLLNPDRSKLSKRQGDVAVEDYLKKGYLKEALLNFVLLLGWNPGDEKEIFTLDEMIKEFSLDKVHKSGAIFNTQKLDWLNSEYIKKLSLKEFQKLAEPFLKNNVSKIQEGISLEKIYILEQERINKLSEIGENIRFFFNDDFYYDPKILIWKKSSAKNTLKCLELLYEEIKNYKTSEWKTEIIKEKISEFIVKNDLNNGEVLWPMRVALTGMEKSPPPFEVADILGKEKSLKRIVKAAELLKKNIN